MHLRVLLALACGLIQRLVLGQPAADTNGLEFSFREPRLRAYRVELPTVSSRAIEPGAKWLSARLLDGSGRKIELGSRIVLEVASPSALSNLLAGGVVRVDRVVRSNLFVLEAPDAMSAAREAKRLARCEGVTISHPVRRQGLKLHGPFAPKPNDPFFAAQWHLENRDTNTAARLGPDLNARAAWPASRGRGVMIGVADNGLELAHPDLLSNVLHTNHHNFINDTTNGTPASVWQAHGTAVAGLAAAAGGNRRGVAGVAPEAQLASLVIWDSTDSLGSEEQVMDLLQFRSNTIWVQNHSWGNSGVEQLEMSVLEKQGLANAIEKGRGGLGAVFTRAAGNERAAGNNANDDGYLNDPRVIGVGAARNNGSVASYSTPGACILVAGLSGDADVSTAEGGVTNYPLLVTTDRIGTLGYNIEQAGDDRADYVYGHTGFTGTSGSCPQVAGLAALVLSANPSLSYRDVQQILVLSARQLDPADPDTQPNGAGFPVSHNVGFGVPDAGQAVKLARAWPTRPALARVTVTNDTQTAVPDDGLRLRIVGAQVPSTLASIPAFPFDGPHPDDPTALLPLVNVGHALEPITNNLVGKAALIERGTNYFAQKIRFAAEAGAGFVVIFNNRDGDERVFMNGADIHLSPVPAVFIGQNDGLALRDYLAQNPQATAQVRLEAAKLALEVTNTLVCEHVTLRARFSHPRRADVRLCLVSPMGTRSVLQRFNQDLSTQLDEWTYSSVHHFYESSAGIWTVEVADERPGITGRLLSVELSILGVRIADADRDGLDDSWETIWLAGLAYGPKDDPDNDGLSNAREQLLNTDPLRPDSSPEIDISRWDANLVRLSWPAMPAMDYAVYATSELGKPAGVLTNIPGQFPETEWLTSSTNLSEQFFRVDSHPRR